MATSLLNVRHLVAIGSALLFVMLGVAFFLVYQNAGIMRDQINEDFNQQQLILARQAAAQVRTSLEDVAAEVGRLGRRLPGLAPRERDEALRAAFERTRAKGLVDIGLLDAAAPWSARTPRVRRPPPTPGARPRRARAPPPGRRLRWRRSGPWRRPPTS